MTTVDATSTLEIRADASGEKLRATGLWDGGEPATLTVTFRCAAGPRTGV
jgi:hypothetical protein